MGDLQELDRCIPQATKKTPAQLEAMVMPLRGAAWAHKLRGHPDAEFSQFILLGIKHGFRIGFDYPNHRCVSAKRNMRSASMHPQPIDQYIGKECTAGRIIGLLPRDTEGILVSRVGVIPKPHQPGKWHLITDLSSPKGSSLNDGITPPAVLAVLRVS